MTRFPLVLYYSCLSFFFLSFRKYRRTKVSIVLEIIYQVSERKREKERLFSKVFWRIRGSFYSHHAWVSRWIYLCNYFNIILKLLILINKKGFRWFWIYQNCYCFHPRSFYRRNLTSQDKKRISFEFIKIAIVFVIFLDLFLFELR